MDIMFKKYTIEIMFNNQFKNKQWKLCSIINSKINNGNYV